MPASTSADVSTTVTIQKALTVADSTIASVKEEHGIATTGAVHSKMFAPDEKEKAITVASSASSTGVKAEVISLLV